jgi:1,2-diacylglycerol 3-beta-galactosyltransferase
MLRVMSVARHGTIAAGRACGQSSRGTAAPLLFLIADTGGGHRTAARAVSQALDRAYPGRFAPVLCDPLAGPGSARLLRLWISLYGPVTRLAPWLWGAAYHGCDSRPAMWLLHRILLRLTERPATDAAAAVRPAAIVSFHPLTCLLARHARDLAAPQVPVVTVITDLAQAHTAWRYPGVDAVAGPPGALRHNSRGRRAEGSPPTFPAGMPVTRDFWAGPLERGERACLRRSLRLDEHGFVVLLTGGGEGSGGIGRRAAAILRRFADVHVVAVCGRNRRLERRLGRLAARSGGRLTVTGFTSGMAGWLRCCDVVVTKAGPGTIAEASCCGTPMLLTSHLPGQEAGNAEVVTGAGAGRQARTVRRLLAEIGTLQRDRTELQALRAAAAGLGQPGAAAAIAGLIASLVSSQPGASSHADDAPEMALPAGTWPGGMAGDQC